MTDDWQNIGGTVQAGLVLSPMDMNVEHVFELQSVEPKMGVQTPFGIKDQIQLVFKEIGKEKDFHRVWVKFNLSFAEKSGLMGFISRASLRPVLPGITIKLGDYLEIGMKISSLVQARIDKKTGLPNGYYDFIPASIKPAGSLAMPKENPVVTQKPDATLANALLLAKGATSGTDAYFKLVEAKCPIELLQGFLVADKAGQIKYPI